jgi:hypothetical protein
MTIIPFSVLPFVTHKTKKAYEKFLFVRLASAELDARSLEKQNVGHNSTAFVESETRTPRRETVVIKP